jgi:signal transduction histidine kinase
MKEYSEGTKMLKIDLSVLNQNLHIRVSDTGKGIAHKNLKKIFSHGFTTSKEGFGFGLHSCANLANEMGGSISAESDGENKGASFLVKIPINNKVST